MNIRGKAFVGFLVFVGSLTYFLSYSRYGLAYDEGYLLDAVEKLQQGQVIYRDFHHTYAPGRFYLIQACFSIFGKNIMVERVIFAILQATKCLLGFLIISDLGGGIFSLLLPILVMVAPGPWHKVFFSTMGFLSIYVAIRVFEKDILHFLLAGLLIGLAGIFRQDVAGFTAIAFVLSFLIYSKNRKQSPKGYLKSLGVFCLGGAIAVVPVLGYFASKGAFAQMYHNILRDGMIDNMTNRIPYPKLLPKAPFDFIYLGMVLPVKIVFYLPFLTYAAMAFYLIRRLVLKGIDRVWAGLLIVFIVSLLSFNQSLWRSDIAHLLQTSQYVFLLLAILASAFWRVVAKRFDSGKAAAILFILPVAFYFWATVACLAGFNRQEIARRFSTEGVSILDSEYIGSMLVRVGNNTRLEIERAPIIVTPRQAAFISAIKSFLDENTSPGDYVLGIPQLQFIYFFFDRRNPTRYAHYRRALEPQEEDRYIDDIKRNDPRYILLLEPREGSIEATREPFAVFAQKVRSWILENYEQVGTIGVVKVLRKRE
ncbi:MAG: hypothetical protein ACUVUU_05700 [bacterium]